MTFSAEHLRTSQPEPLWQTVGYALFLDAGVYSLYEYLPYISDTDTKYLIGQDPVREGSTDDILHDIENVFPSVLIADLKRVLDVSPLEMMLSVGVAMWEPADNAFADALWVQLDIAVQAGLPLERAAVVARALVQRGGRPPKSVNSLLAKMRPLVKAGGDV